MTLAVFSWCGMMPVLNEVFIMYVRGVRNVWKLCFSSFVEILSCPVLVFDLRDLIASTTSASLISLRTMVCG